jgi:hypothetical protein
MHLDAETLERVLHGELDEEREAAARGHLSNCPACVAALEESRLRERRLFGLFEALDHAAPGLDWQAVEAPGTGGSRGLLVAASIAFVLAAGILYALPDSPLRSWIDRTGREAPAGEAEAGPVGARSVSGLSIRPAGPFEIGFAGRQESGTIRVELADTPEVEIRVLGAPVGLESGPDRVTVANLGSRSDYAIRLPEAGPPVTVRVGNVAVFIKSVAGVRTAAPRFESGEYRIDLSRPGP